MNKNLMTQCGALVGIILLALGATAAQGAGVAIEDFEGELAIAPAVKTGWEAKGSDHSTAAIAKVGDAKRGSGAAEIAFDVKPGGWALAQKKFEGAEWLKKSPKSISFWLKGGGTGKMEVELEESYTFKWRKEVPLTNKDWHLVTIKLNEFTCPDKVDMSPPDLVAVKFVGSGGAAKFVVDDIQVECVEP